MFTHSCLSHRRELMFVFFKLCMEEKTSEITGKQQFNHSCSKTAYLLSRLLLLSGHEGTVRHFCSSKDGWAAGIQCWQAAKTGITRAQLANYCTGYQQPTENFCLTCREKKVLGQGYKMIFISSCHPRHSYWGTGCIYIPLVFKLPPMFDIYESCFSQLGQELSRFLHLKHKVRFAVFPTLPSSKYIQ